MYEFAISIEKMKKVIDMIGFKSIILMKSELPRGYQFYFMMKSY